MKQFSKLVVLKKLFALAIQMDEYKIHEFVERSFIECRWTYVCLLCGTSYYGEYSRHPHPLAIHGFVDHISKEHNEWETAYWFEKKRPIYEKRKGLKTHPLKPWKDPDSLYCDKEFLEKLLSKEIAEGNECKG